MASFSTKSFTYNAATRTFITDMSDLDRGSRVEVFHQIYPDAADGGLTLISERTMAQIDYAIQSEPDDDRNYWVLVPASTRGKQIPPGARGTKIIIVNT